MYFAYPLPVPAPSALHTCTTAIFQHHHRGQLPERKPKEDKEMSRAGKKSKKISESNKTYAETEYFSQRHRQWSRYHVLRPRLPRPTDEKWLETVFQPKTLKTFVGKHNHEVTLFFYSLTHLLNSRTRSLRRCLIFATTLNLHNNFRINLFSMVLLALGRVHLCELSSGR
jgi:hypothetical protein